MASYSHTFTEANRTFFDDLAVKYDIKPWQKKAALQATNYIQENVDFIGIPAPASTARLLDYACGTGMISRALGPSVGSIQAVDLSSKMVERYKELAKESDIPSVCKARAIEGNLLTDSDPEAALNGQDLYEFDIAAVGLGVHHFSDPAKAIGRLAERLKVGGVLLIVDFLEEDDRHWHPTDADHVIHKHGFVEGEMKDMMERHGLGEFGWSLKRETVDFKMEEDMPMNRKIFLARAAKLSPGQN